MIEMTSTQWVANETLYGIDHRDGAYVVVCDGRAYRTYGSWNELLAASKRFPIPADILKALSVADRHRNAETPRFKERGAGHWLEPGGADDDV